MNTRWRKVLLDLWTHKARTLLVVAAIGVGVFAVGLVAGGQTILLRELDRGYQALDAASATLVTDPFDDALARRIAGLPGVATAEGRRTLPVKVVLGPDETVDLLLTAVPDLASQQLDRLVLLSGEAAPRTGSALIEQLSLDYLQAAEGESLRIRLADDTEKDLPIAGLVHYANVPNAQIANRAFGFISLDTAAELGLADAYTELRYRVAGDVTDLARIEAVSAQIETQLERSGRTVYAVDTPTPGEHWAQEIIETLVLLFILFGGLIMVLSGFLVINTISALMAQQVKQIGVMKLVGARRRQIVAMYFGMVAAYGGLALLVSLPASVLAAQRIVLFATDLLNVRIVDNGIPARILLIQAAGGLGVPLLAAVWPVIRGVRITTFQALNSLGIEANPQGAVERLFARLQQALPLQRPLLISLRNTIRKKGRLALTLATLIMGTALFIAVLSVRASVAQTVDSFLRYHAYDVSIALARPYRAAQLQPLTQQLPEVVATEGWLTGGVRRVYADGSSSAGISLTAAPGDTRFMNPELVQGRWLTAADTDAIVVNVDFMEAHPDLALGDAVLLEGSGRQLTWRIVGIVASAADDTAVYVNYAPYARATRSVGLVTSLKVVGAQHDAASQERLAVEVTQQLEEAGIRIGGQRTTEGIRAANEYRFNVIIGFLVLMAVLLAAVGSLGLTTTMSINILERIREIGVLRAIGASDGAVRLVVLVEGIVIGLISWVFGAALAVPVSQLLSRTVGMALMGTPLHFRFALDWTFIWLLLVVLLATAASLGPARSASKLTIREVLAYE